MEDDEVLALPYAGPNGRIPLFKLNDNFLGGDACHARVDPNLKSERLVAYDVVHHHDIQPWNTLERPHHVLADHLDIRQSLLVISGHPVSDGGYGSDDLLPVDLVRPADTPDSAAFVAYEGLLGDLSDHVLGAQRKPDGLRGPQIFGRDALKVGAHPDVLAE